MGILAQCARCTWKPGTVMPPGFRSCDPCGESFAPTIDAMRAYAGLHFGDAAPYGYVAGLGEDLGEEWAGYRWDGIGFYVTDANAAKARPGTVSRVWVGGQPDGGAGYAWMHFWEVRIYWGEIGPTSLWRTWRPGKPAATHMGDLDGVTTATMEALWAARTLFDAINKGGAKKGQRPLTEEQRARLNAVRALQASKGISRREACNRLTEKPATISDWEAREGVQ